MTQHVLEALLDATKGTAWFVLGYITMVVTVGRGHL